MTSFFVLTKQNPIIRWLDSAVYLTALVLFRINVYLVLTALLVKKMGRTY